MFQLVVLKKLLKQMNSSFRLLLKYLNAINNNKINGGKRYDERKDKK